MSEIPDDIRKAAYDLGAAIRHHIATSEAELIEHDATIDDMIAMTILAERERCAMVADDYSRGSLYADWPDDARSAGYYACGDVAEAIRNPKEPTQKSSINDDDLPF